MKSQSLHRLAASLGLLSFAFALTASAAQPDGEIFLDPEEPPFPQWGYDEFIPPDAWGLLLDEAGNVAFPTCETGVEQSPIDIRGRRISESNRLPALEFNYHPTALAIENNGRTIEVPYNPGSSMTIGSEVYDLLQFHFHSPSEHTFQRGGRFELELHAVHRNAAGRLAVVGIFITRGADNPGFPTGRFLAQVLPRVEGVEFEFPANTVNLADLLPPAGTRTFRYNGSLTTPPCSVQPSTERRRVANSTLGGLAFTCVPMVRSPAWMWVSPTATST